MGCSARLAVAAVPIFSFDIRPPRRCGRAHYARADTKRRFLRSSLAVRRENVILGRYSGMAREAAIDDAGRIGLERVRRGIIVKRGVCPSLGVRESLAVFLDEKDVL